MHHFEGPCLLGPFFSEAEKANMSVNLEYAVVTKASRLLEAQTPIKPLSPVAPQVARKYVANSFPSLPAWELVLVRVGLGLGGQLGHDF